MNIFKLNNIFKLLNVVVTFLKTYGNLRQLPSAAGPIIPECGLI